MPQADLIVKRSVGTLLNAADFTQAQITAAVNEGIDIAAAQLAAKRKQDRERQAALIALLLMLSPEIAAKIKRAIAQGRQNARKLSIKRLLAELAAAGIVLSESDLAGGRPLVTKAHMNRAHDDDVYATQAAESLVTQWRGIAVVSIVAASRRGDADTKALKRTKALMRSRIERTAATESSHAYNDEHNEAFADALAYDDALEREVTSAGLVQEWSAMADACPMCWPHDGEQVPISEAFSDGAIPGDMHPRCRCISIYVPARESEVAA